MMPGAVTLSEIIATMVQSQGETVLLDPQRMLALFMDLAPQLKREKELLRVFSLCDGPSKMLNATKASYRDRELYINKLVKELEDNYGMSGNSAKYLCAEFYRGITGNTWTSTSPETDSVEGTATNSIHSSRKKDATAYGNSSRMQNEADRYESTIQTQRHWWLVAVVAVLLLCVLLIPKLGSKQSGQTIETPGVSNQTAQNQSSTGKTPQSNAPAHVHQWKDATCTSPKKCSTCGETSGQKLSHEWMPATFTAAKTCAVCKCTEGEAIDYQSISVESEVSLIRDVYNSVESNVNSGYFSKENLREGVKAYHNSNGALVCVIVFRGTEGIGDHSQDYSRSYYFEKGKLVFAFFEGASDSHRLYFYDELLIRWRHTVSGGKAHNYDFTFSEEYYLWERLALSEAETFY